MADTPPPPPTPPPSEPTPPSPSPSTPTARSRRQLSLFLAGAGFFALSTLITRRALLRKYKAAVPAFYSPNNGPAREINGTLEALEALNLATINVMSFGMMVAGGTLWALDISGLEELRRRVRVDDGTGGMGGVEGKAEQVEEGMEEWVAIVLARKGEEEKGKEKGKEKGRRDGDADGNATNERRSR